MNRARDIVNKGHLVESSGSAGPSFGCRPGLWVAAALLIFCFAVPLYRLVMFAVGDGSELYSYILLIPFVSGFLIRIGRHGNAGKSTPKRGVAMAFSACGLGILAGYWIADQNGVKLATDDRLAFATSSFLMMFYGVCCFFLGRETLSRVAFPLGLLMFIVPFPERVMQAVEVFLQHGSAIVAAGLFSITGTTFSREGLLFHLPAISIQVAPECSGVHSSLVLLIVSLVAGYFFLKSPVRRMALALAVVPLALLRNGLRIFTIGQLCIRIGPEMIDSSFHHKWGGTAFFILSLVPFLCLLYFLQKSERAKVNRSAGDVPSNQMGEQAGGNAA